jgi:hypothetical protein
MDKNERLRLLLEELLKQELIVKNFNEHVPGHLAIRKEMLGEIINSSEYGKIRAQANRPSSDGRWATEYRDQIVQEENDLDKRIEEQRVQKKRKIDNTTTGRQAEIAEAKIKIIRAMIEKLAGKEILEKLGKLELEEVLDEYIEKKFKKLKKRGEFP